MKKEKMLKCCYGISSKVDRWEHVFMVDYDGVSQKRVIDHLVNIQERYDLSDIYLIESTHGHNAICLDKLPLSLIYMIGMSRSSPADKDFFKFGFDRGYYVLRFWKDKQLVGILRRDSRKRYKSNSHRVFLNWFFNIDIDKDVTFDDNTKLELVQYPSEKNGFHYMPREYVLDDK